MLRRRGRLGPPLDDGLAPRDEHLRIAARGVGAWQPAVNDALRGWLQG